MLVILPGSRRLQDYTPEGRADILQRVRDMRRGMSGTGYHHDKRRQICSKQDRLDEIERQKDG